MMSIQFVLLQVIATVWHVVGRCIITIFNPLTWRSIFHFLTDPNTILLIILSTCILYVIYQMAKRFATGNEEDERRLQAIGNGVADARTELLKSIKSFIESVRGISDALILFGITIYFSNFKMYYLVTILLLYVVIAIIHNLIMYQKLVIQHQLSRILIQYVNFTKSIQ